MCHRLSNLMAGEERFQVPFPEIPEEEIYFAVVGDVHGQFKSAVTLVSQQAKKFEKRNSLLCCRLEILNVIEMKLTWRRMGNFHISIRKKKSSHGPFSLLVAIMIAGRVRGRRTSHPQSLLCRSV